MIGCWKPEITFSEALKKLFWLSITLEELTRLDTNATKVK
jgi:hypothetical protein